MAQRLCCFLVVFLLMFNGEIWGQENPHFEGKNCLDQSKVNRQIIKKSIDLMNKPVNGIAEKSISKIEIYTPVHIVMPGCGNSKPRPSYYSFNISAEYYTNNLGFFCKQELQLDKITSVPLRFRLGSTEYVNWMEQKPNAIKPGL